MARALLDWTRSPSRWNRFSGILFQMDPERRHRIRLVRFETELTQRVIDLRRSPRSTIGVEKPSDVCEGSKWIIRSISPGLFEIRMTTTVPRWQPESLVLPQVHRVPLTEGTNTNNTLSELPRL
jgi:hypothetical protein